MTQRKAAEAARNQFDSCLKMLGTLTDVCPDSVWNTVYNDTPFWYQVYHVVYFVDYWFRADYTTQEFKTMKFDERIPPEFEYDVDNTLVIPRTDMKEYLRRVSEKTTRIFDKLKDEDLSKEIGMEGYTYMDVIMAQTRHIMYNIGYLNGILRSLGLEESDWWAYNEHQEG